MAKAIIMPKFEMSQEFGTIIQWLKKDGDTVKRGEPILEVETDKVTMEVEAPGNGILGGLKGEPGEEIPVTVTIGYLLKEGEAVPTEEEAAPAPVVEVEETPEPVKEETAPAASAKVTPVAKNLAEAKGVDLAEVSGTGVGGKVTKKDVEAAIETPAQSVAVPGKILATPAAKRVARMTEIDLATVTGTGPDGRIQETDVFAALRGAQTGSVQQRVAEERPFFGMRKKIAERMVESYQTIPHVLLLKKIDMTAFNQLRDELNAKAEKLGKTRISATALLLKLIALTLDKHRLLNASLQDDRIVLQPNFNIGMAVAIDEGLIVPVIRDADQLSIFEIAEQVKALAVKARNGELNPGDVKGGTFTVSNLGPFGIEQFTSIINPGQSAILAVGATEDELTMDRETGEVYYKSVMRVNLSVDHRIVDGAVGAKFLVDLQEMIENPALAMLA